MNRYYDSSTDQFLSVDAMVQTTGQPYVFTNDNPLNATDPLGQCGGWFHVICSASDFVGRALGAPGRNFVTQSKGLGLVISGALLIVGTDSIATALVVATALGAPEDASLIPAETGFVGGLIIAGNATGFGLIATGLSEGEVTKPKPKLPTPKLPTPTKSVPKKK